jgi:hypothetical protein
VQTCAVARRRIAPHRGEPASARSRSGQDVASMDSCVWSNAEGAVLGDRVTRQYENPPLAGEASWATVPGQFAPG